MRISTYQKVILDEAEIKEAVAAYVELKLELAGTSTLTVEFEDPTGENLIAVVDVVSGGDEPKSKEPAKPAAPKTSRKKAAEAPVVAQEPETPEPKGEAATEAPVTQDEVVEAAVVDNDDAPFETDDKPEESNVVPITTETPVASKPAGIFANTGSSAPVLPEVQQEAADKAKSLFAKFAKPIGSVQ